MNAVSHTGSDPEDDGECDGCDGVEHADPSLVTPDEDLPPSQGGVAAQ